jgi:photosystem II stability/assembly factor-like uncharacterized protein
MIQENLWHQLPPLVHPFPVFALTAGQNGIWAGSLGGVARYPSTEPEEVWQPCIAGLPISSVMALFYTNGVLLAGGVGGVAYSHNGGRRWQAARLEDISAIITHFIASPQFTSDRTILAATLSNGILRSDDAGRTWKSANFGLEGTEVKALTWSNSSNVLAATAEGIYRSPNAGRAWKHLFEAEDIDALIYLPSGEVVATLESGGLLHSTDGGTNWSLKTNTLQGTALYVTASNTLLMGTTSNGLVRSTDGGTSWQTVDNMLVHIFTAGRDALYAGTERGVSLSYDDGLTWHELPSPPLYDFRQLLLDSGHPHLVGSYSGIAVYSSYERRWGVLAASPVPISAVATAPDGSWMVANAAGITVLPTNRLSVATSRTELSGMVSYFTSRQATSGWEAWALLTTPEEKQLLYSHDQGTTWQAQSTPFGILPPVALQATADRLIAATYDTRQQRVCIWISDDDGVSWQRSIEAETDWPHVSTCAQPPLITVGNVILVQRPPAQHWHKVGILDHGSMIRRVVSIHKDQLATLFVLTTNGIYSSEDEGASWQRYNEELPGEHILDIACDETNVFALLSGGRVWQRALTKPDYNK